MFPVVHALERSYRFEPVVVTTGQHRDLVQPILDLAGITPDLDLGVVPGLTLNDLVASVITGLDAFCRERFHASGASVATRDQIRERGFPAGALVHGDTSSAVAAAIAAFNLRIPVGHVEAGLRTGTTLTPYPEELNRQLISRIAAFHLAPTSINRQNLVREGIPDERVFVTGNTGLDALQFAAALDVAFENDALRAMIDRTHAIRRGDRPPQGELGRRPRTYCRGDRTARGDASRDPLRGAAAPESARAPASWAIRWRLCRTSL